MSALLPTVRIGGLSVTRLILGGNPLRGNSHTSPALDREMLEWHTVANIKAVLGAAEAAGINTLQARGDVLVQACVREHWAGGGTLQFIAQTASELRDLPGHIAQLASFGAQGIYLHGTWTDRQYFAGNLGEVRDLLARIRDTGAATGLGTHMPVMLDVAESEGWDLDFYMAGLHNLSAPDRESALERPGAAAVERFVHEDREQMLLAVRRTAKPCLVFKVFGAGRYCATPEETQRVLAAVYGAVKPVDAVVAGMFNKHHDQVAENAATVRAALAG